jgi:hypothetical protein
MGVTGPLIFYGLGAVVIGQLLWWAYLIHQNRDYAFALPCYGETGDQKWGWLADRLVSPGVFLFYQFRYNRVFWGFFLPMSKLITVAGVQIAEYFSGGVSWAVLFIYIAIIVLNVIFMPYRFPFNNIFDIATGGSNVLLTIFAVANFHNAGISPSVQSPLTMIVVVLPLLALGYGFVRKAQTPQPGEQKTIGEDGKETTYVPEVWEELGKDEVWLFPIWMAEELEKADRREDVIELNPDVGAKVDITSAFVDGKLKECQEKVDQICDASSTSHVVTMMKGATLLACCCAGWFFGGVSGRFELGEVLDC